MLGVHTDCTSEYLDSIDKYSVLLHTRPKRIIPGSVIYFEKAMSAMDFPAMNPEGKNKAAGLIGEARQRKPKDKSLNVAGSAAIKPTRRKKTHQDETGTTGNGDGEIYLPNYNIDQQKEPGNNGAPSADVVHVEPAMAEVLLRLADASGHASNGATTQTASGADIEYDSKSNFFNHMVASGHAVLQAQSVPFLDSRASMPGTFGMLNGRMMAGPFQGDGNMSNNMGPPDIKSQEFVSLTNFNGGQQANYDGETQLNTQEAATQSAVAALLGFAFQAQEKPAAEPTHQQSRETSYDDSDIDGEAAEDLNSDSGEEAVDTSILSPEVMDLAEAWVASKTDNSKKADWEYIEAHTTGRLHEIIKEKRHKFADTFVENSLFHLREYIPKGAVKTAFLAYRNGIAKRRFGVSDAYKSKPRKKAEVVNDNDKDNDIDDENSESQKAPGRRRRYGEISLVVKELEYNKPLEDPIMIDCHLTQELIELTKLLVAYNIVPAGRGGKIKLEHLERAGASENLIMLCNSKRTSKIYETITLTNLISSKYVRDGFETFLAEATRSYNNGGPIFGSTFCSRDIEEGKLSIPIALGLKEEHKELSRLLLLGNKGNVKTTKTRSFEWKLVDWDVVVTHASEALASKISARRKNKSFTNHAINNLVNNNAEQKAIIVYIERLRRHQLGLIPSRTLIYGEPNEDVEPNEIAKEPETDPVIKTDASVVMLMEGDQSHKPLKKRKRIVPRSQLETTRAKVDSVLDLFNVRSQGPMTNHSPQRTVEKNEVSADDEAVLEHRDEDHLKTQSVIVNNRDHEDSEMLLSVGVTLNDEALKPKGMRSIANMENCYKARMTDDGCYRPSRDPQKKGDGTFARPRGRGPPGMGWDAVRGLFIPGKGGQQKKGNKNFQVIEDGGDPHFIETREVSKDDLSDLDDEGDDESDGAGGESKSVAKPSSKKKQKIACASAHVLIADITVGGESRDVVQSLTEIVTSPNKSRKVECHEQTSPFGRTSVPAGSDTETSEPKPRSDFTPDNDSLRAFVWISAYCSLLCEYDQRAHCRRRKFSQLYAVDWRFFLGGETQGDRNAFVDVQRKRLAVFKEEEEDLLEDLKTEALKIFSCAISESSKLTTLSVALSNLAENFIDRKIVEFSVVSGVMGRSLDTYMYLMEERELKWDDFHALQEAKLAKYEQSMSWNEHLASCHNAIASLYP